MKYNWDMNDGILKDYFRYSIFILTGLDFRTELLVIFIKRKKETYFTSEFCGAIKTLFFKKNDYFSVIF